MHTNSLLLVCLFLLITGCSTVPPEPYSQTAVNTSSNNLTDEPLVNVSQPKNQTRTSAEDQRQQRFLAKGGGIFDFNVLTKENCDAYLTTYKEMIEQAEEDVHDAEEELAEEERDLQKARSAFTQAQREGNERAKDRAREDIDDEEKDVDAMQDLLDEKTEYLRKLKIIVAEMKLACPRLKAST